MSDCIGYIVRGVILEFIGYYHTHLSGLPSKTRTRTRFVPFRSHISWKRHWQKQGCGI